MLIPAFSMMGAGVAQVLQITYGNQYVNRDPKRQVEILGASNNALPPQKTEFVRQEKGERYETGELVPHSVVENTTRLLEIDAENETMTLPKND